MKHIMDVYIQNLDESTEYLREDAIPEKDRTRRIRILERRSGHAKRERFGEDD
jgi:hypothetical protein